MRGEFREFINRPSYICIQIKGGFRHKQIGRLTLITDRERLSLFHILLALLIGMVDPVKPN